MGRRQRLRMTDDEQQHFLEEERVLRLATIDEAGWPAVVPVWYVEQDGDIWIWNLDRAQRTARLREGTKVGVCVDGGEEYAELRGVTARATYAFVAPDDVPLVVREKMGRKYFGLEEPVGHVDDHTWIRLELTDVQSWDFRKIFS